MASLIFIRKLVETESRILKQSSEKREQQFSEPLKCLKMWNVCRRRDVHGCEYSEVSIGFTNITGTSACT